MKSNHIILTYILLTGVGRAGGDGVAPSQHYLYHIYTHIVYAFAYIIVCIFLYTYDTTLFNCYGCCVCAMIEAVSTFNIILFRSSGYRFESHRFVYIFLLLYFFNDYISFLYSIVLVIALSFF